MMGGTKRRGSKYKGVSKPPSDRGLGYVAQSRPHGFYKARFATAHAAACWLAGRLGVSTDSLLWQSLERIPAVMPVSRHHGVHFHANRGKHRWEAFSRRGELLGTFATQDAAVRRACRSWGVDEKALRKEDDVIMKHATAKALFRAAYRVFKRYRFGDLVSMREHERKSKRMYAEDQTR